MAGRDRTQTWAGYAPRLRRHARRRARSRSSLLHEVALGLDAPALADLDQIVVERPAVGGGIALVLGRRALERHRAGVVADRADGGELGLRERRLGGDRGELRALGLDGLGLLARLLD